jgi:mannose-6-phosphate isomerase-like protein (cupin superfamily)
MNYIIEGTGALVNEKGEETPLKAGDFALVNPDEKHQYRNKGDVPFKMICGVAEGVRMTEELLISIMPDG